jgi:hypothetical protein
MKPRPTDVEFDELKRKRDASINASIDSICAEHGWDRSEVQVHVSGSADCYCACPDGPCQHIWDGPDIEFDDGHGMSASCSRCGTLAFSHDMRCAP